MEVDNPDDNARTRISPDTIIERRGPITQEELSLRGPGGLGFSFKGQSQQLLTVILILVMAGALGYLISQHDKDQQVTNKAMQDSQTRIEKHMTEQDETMQAMIYVLALPEKEREKLNLNKPHKLAEMQR